MGFKTEVFFVLFFWDKNLLQQYKIHWTNYCLSFWKCIITAGSTLRFGQLLVMKWCDSIVIKWTYRSSHKISSRVRKCSQFVYLVCLSHSWGQRELVWLESCLPAASSSYWCIGKHDASWLVQGRGVRLIQNSGAERESQREMELPSTSPTASQKRNKTIIFVMAAVGYHCPVDDVAVS